MRSRLCFCGAAIFLTLLVRDGFAAGPEKPIDVCTLLMRLGEFKGRVVTVKGVLNGSHHHGFFLDYDGPPCQELEGLIFSWPAIIELGHLDPAHTQTDLDHYWRAVNEARRRSIEGILDPVPVVVRGRVETKLMLFIFKRKEGNFWGNGYGRFGDFPALIRPIRISMIEQRITGSPQAGVANGRQRAIADPANPIATAPNVWKR